MNTAQIAEIRETLGLEDVAPADDDEQQELHKMYQSYLEEHGANPATREQAAACGAGHLIIAASLGLEGALRVTLTTRSDNPRWVAETNLQLVPLKECYSETADPLAVLKSSLHCLGGSAGERFKGLGHPNSALNMGVKAYLYASYLDHVFHVPTGTYFNRIWDLAQGILAFNEATFDELYLRLLSKGAFDRELDGSLLANVQPAVLNQIFGSIQ